MTRASALNKLLSMDYTDNSFGTIIIIMMNAAVEIKKGFLHFLILS